MSLLAAVCHDPRLRHTRGSTVTIPSRGIFTSARHDAAQKKPGFDSFEGRAQVLVKIHVRAHRDKAAIGVAHRRRTGDEKEEVVQPDRIGCLEYIRNRGLIRREKDDLRLLSIHAHVGFDFFETRAPG